MFEKVNIQDLKFNPFDEISNHWVLISAKKDGVVNTMTASWGQLGHLWGKNVMTVYIRPQRYTKEFVDAGDYFTVTLFDGYKKELGVLGSKSGRDGDKIAEVSFDIEEVENQPTFKQGKIRRGVLPLHRDHGLPRRLHQRRRSAATAGLHPQYRRYPRIKSQCSVSVR